MKIAKSEKTEFWRRKGKEREEEARKKIAEKMPHLPPLLDDRRKKFLMPDEVFDYQATYDRVFIVQVGSGDQETFGGGPIIKADTTQSREQNQAPFGVVVSAGLNALDNLKSHGIDLGHIVCHTRVSPQAIKVENEIDPDYWILVLVSGEVSGSVDLAHALKAGKCSVKYDPESGKHNYVDKNGDIWTPESSFEPEVRE